MNKHTANVFLPGCLGPVKRDVVLADDLEFDEEAERFEFEEKFGSGDRTEDGYTYAPRDQAWQGWKMCAHSKVAQ